MKQEIGKSYEKEKKFIIGNHISHLDHFIYAIIFAIMIATIVYIKITHSNFKDPVVYPYTILITTFMLSRVVGSFFYKPYKEKLKPLEKIKLKEGFHPKVTFTIPSKNEEKSIYKTISSCLDSNYPKDKLEIIAINDGSTDNTLGEMTRAKNDFKNYSIKIISYKKNKGKREAMGLAIRRATGEFIIQVDSDSYPAKKALQEIINPFIDSEVGATVGHTDPVNKDTNVMTRLQTAYYFMSFRALKATESIFNMVFCCSGCFAAYRRSVLLQVLDRWLDEKFLGKKVIFGDDRSLTNWVLRQGYHTVYVDEAQAYTEVPETLKQFLKQQIRWKKGWFINSIKIAPFVVKKDKFVAFTYFIPLIILTLLTPFIALKALVINPLFLGISPLFYISGIMIVSIMLYAHYHLYANDKYGKYMIVYSMLNMTVLSYVLIYALYDLRNMSWGTR